MPPAEWMELTGTAADPKLVAALLQVWCTYVMPNFAARMGCTLT